MLSLGTWKKLPPPQGLGETVLAFTKGSGFSHPQKRSQGALRLKSESLRPSELCDPAPERGRRTAAPNAPSPGAATASPSPTPQTSRGGTDLGGRAHRLQISLLSFKLQQGCSAHFLPRDTAPGFPNASSLSFPTVQRCHPPPKPGLETPRPWGWGKGEEEKRGMASLS